MPLYILFMLVDECGGCIDINVDVARRFFSNEYQVVMVESLDGAKGLSATKSKIDKRYNEMIQEFSKEMI